MATRYSYGADEHIFVELAEEMSLAANLRAMAITTVLEGRNLAGVYDICPANASYQVRFNPDELRPEALREILVAVEEEVGDAADFSLDTRVLEVPVLYGDPWTTETLMRFRDRHQAPELTDLEYAAKINGFGSTEEFIEAHSGAPWFTSMVGFVAGLPFLYQMVERERQLEVPKYLRPRTDTPPLTVGHGGCFGCIYSVRGAGGYQMFGITPGPIFDPQQRGADFAEFMAFFRPGDIVSFKPISREEYDEGVAAAEAGTFHFRKANVEFRLDTYAADPDGYNASLQEVLDAS